MEKMSLCSALKMGRATFNSSLREGSWYWPHSLVPLDFSPGSLESRTTWKAGRTVPWSTVTQIQRRNRSGTITIVAIRTRHMGCYFRYVKDVFEEIYLFQLRCYLADILIYIGHYISWLEREDILVEGNGWFPEQRVPIPKSQYCLQGPLNWASAGFLQLLELALASGLGICLSPEGHSPEVKTMCSYTLMRTVKPYYIGVGTHKMNPLIWKV